MSTIFVFFALPIGLVLYFWDKKNVAAADHLFDAFIAEVKANETLSDGEKLRHIDNMFYENGFKTVELGEKHLITQKKHLNLGVPIIMFGVLSYIGVFVFIFYYFYWLKPLRKEVRLP